MALLALLRRRYLMRWLRFNALRKGLFGGNSAWLAVLGMGIVLRAVNSVLKKGPMELVFSEKLEPGASYMITHLPPPLTRRQQRKDRKKARRATQAVT
jgi:hypothetical protein